LIEQWSRIESAVWGEGSSTNREVADIIRGALSEPRRDLGTAGIGNVYVYDVGPWPDGATIWDVLLQPDASRPGMLTTDKVYDAIAHAYREAIDAVGVDVADPDDRVSEATMASVFALHPEDARDFVARHGGES